MSTSSTFATVIPRLTFRVFETGSLDPWESVWSGLVLWNTCRTRRFPESERRAFCWVEGDRLRDELSASRFVGSGEKVFYNIKKP